MKIVYQAVKGEFEQAIRAIYRPLEEAGQETIEEVATAIKVKGRAHIGRAGFSKRWENALRADVYPKKPRISLNAAALIWHKIPYADVFESGAVIRGKPRLWLPLSSTPKKIGRHRMTAERYVRSIGPLTPIIRPGKKPLLAGQMSATKTQLRSGAFGKVSVPRLKKGAGKIETKAAGRTMVPLFVGVDVVTLRKRFALTELIEREADQMAEIFVRKLDAKDV